MPITLRVPQDSVMGPLLFVLLITDIISFINYSLDIYADDTSAEVIGANQLKVRDESEKLLR